MRPYGYIYVYIYMCVYMYTGAEGVRSGRCAGRAVRAVIYMYIYI